MNENGVLRCDVCDSRIRTTGPGKAWCPNCHQEIELPAMKARQ